MKIKMIINMIKNKNDKNKYVNNKNDKNDND